MDEQSPRSPKPPAAPPTLEYVRQSSATGQIRPEVEPNCEQALWLAVVSLLFPPAAIVAFVKAGYGLAEVRRSGKAGHGYAVLAIALGIILPCLFGLAAWRVWAVRSRADVMMCQSNLRQLGQFVALYENAFPAAVDNDIDTVVQHGGDGLHAVPTCVLAPRDANPTAGPSTQTTYMLLPRTRRLSEIPNSASTVLAVDLSAHPRDSGPLTCVLFCDGHSEALHPAEANRLISESIPILLGTTPATSPAAERKPE